MSAEARCDCHCELFRIPLPVMAMFHVVCFGWATAHITGMIYWSNVIYMALLFWVTGDVRPPLPAELFLIFSPFSIIFDVVSLAVTNGLGVGNAHAQALVTLPFLTFGLVMVIFNLVVKPFTTYLVYSEFRSRGGRFECEHHSHTEYASLPGRHD